MPILSKSLENVVHKKRSLETHNLLYYDQYGFRNRNSTAQAVTDFVIDNTKARENNQHIPAIYLDLSKAFDTIDHKILIDKLEYYGVRGQSLDCNQCITCRVPQGYILESLLFIIYTNDLPPSLTDTKAILFANDTTLSSKKPDELYHKINNDLDCLCDGFKANKLPLNIAKTNYMVFSVWE